MVAMVIVLAAPAQAAACEPGAGVTVVVDFGNVGGGVSVGCAPSPSTGIEALTQAGFSLTFVQAQPGFVCRVNGLPGEADEDCVDTPPFDSFWSYWLADPGGSWRSSTTGGGSPANTALVGWSFSLGEYVAPAYAVPPAPTTTTTTSTTTTTPTTTTTTAPPSTTTTKATTTSTTPATSTTTTTTTTTTLATTTTTVPATSIPPTTTAPEPDGSAPEATLVAAAPVAASSPVGVIVGAVLVLGLAGAAWFARSRRRAP